MRRPVLLIPLLLFLVFYFGWKTWGALSSPVDAGAAEVASLPPPSVVAAGTDITPPQNFAAAVSTIVARPLFRPDRQPFGDGGDSGLSRRGYEKELERYTLLGVMLLGGTQVALVTGKVGGQTEHYEVGPGDSLPGFTVKAIQPDGLLLVADGREFLLPLYAGSPKGQAGGGLRTEVTQPAASPPSSPSASGEQKAAPSAAEAVRALRPPDRIQQRGKKKYPSRDRSTLTQQLQTPPRTPVPFRGNIPSPYRPANP